MVLDTYTCARESGRKLRRNLGHVPLAQWTTPWRVVILNCCKRFVCWICVQKTTVLDVHCTNDDVRETTIAPLMWNPVIFSCVSGEHLTCSPPEILLQVIGGRKIVRICWTLRSGGSAVTGKEAQGRHCAVWMGTASAFHHWLNSVQPDIFIANYKWKKKKADWLHDDEGSRINALFAGTSNTRFLTATSSCSIRMTTKRVIPLR